MEDCQFFDRDQPFTIVEKRLPHWTQAGTLCFITWRNADSLPKQVVERLRREREETFRAYRSRVSPRRELPPLELAKLHWKLFKSWDAELDRGAGECILARPELSQIVLDALLHFDDDRYVLTDAVVMPNHVHVLAAFRDEKILLSQCESWKRFSATQIQKSLGRRGEFWQVEQFDHLVRSLEQFEYFRRYIAENPLKARLATSQYRHYSKQLNSRLGETRLP